MKTDFLDPDLFLEAEEAVRGLLAIEHRGRMPIKTSDISGEMAKLEYLRKLVERAGLTTRCEQQLSAILLNKMKQTPHTHMTLNDYALAVLKAVSEELATVPAQGK